MAPGLFLNSVSIDAIIDYSVNISAEPCATSSEGAFQRAESLFNVQVIKR